MTRTDAYETAVGLAVETLRDVDLDQCCPALGLPLPQQGKMDFRAFGRDLTLTFPDFQLYFAGNQEPVKVSDRILVLHYLLCPIPVRFMDRVISFRELAGGQFYWSAFQSRSVKPLEQRFGDRLEQLKVNLSRFDWEPVSIGDLGARIHVMGNVYVTLIYRLGDEEFPPAADFLFDASIKHIYKAEDAAVLASRICLSLL